jgi:hypothetical protein
MITVLPDTTYFLPYEQLYDDIVLPIRKTRERAEAVGVREYGRGDDMRSIHWKYSARIGKLHVKEYEKGTRELHLIYLDLTDTHLKGEADAACKDMLLCSAASLCRTLLREQVPMMILGYAEKESGRFLPYTPEPLGRGARLSCSARLLFRDTRKLQGDHRQLCHARKVNAYDLQHVGQIRSAFLPDISGRRLFLGFPVSDSAGRI